MKGNIIWVDVLIFIMGLLMILSAFGLVDYDPAGAEWLFALSGIFALYISGIPQYVRKTIRKKN